MSFLVAPLVTKRCPSNPKELYSTVDPGPPVRSRDVGGSARGTAALVDAATRLITAATLLTTTTSVSSTVTVAVAAAARIVAAARGTQTSMRRWSSR